jgi:hypothetical protein
MFPFNSDSRGPSNFFPPLRSDACRLFASGTCQLTSHHSQRCLHATRNGALEGVFNTDYCLEYHPRHPVRSTVVMMIPYTPIASAISPPAVVLAVVIAVDPSSPASGSPAFTRNSSTSLHIGCFTIWFEFWGTFTGVAVPGLPSGVPLADDDNVA